MYSNRMGDIPLNQNSVHDRFAFIVNVQVGWALNTNNSHTTGVSCEAQWLLHIVNSALVGRCITLSHRSTQLLDVTLLT